MKDTYCSTSSFVSSTENPSRLIFENLIKVWEEETLPRKLFVKRVETHLIY